ncbi:hypothetical protein L0664_02105 [Octadecabacter sp. G9-8]|uniref:Lipoprotein n=1 Tax=Octadecabacter dasysiphoniae TaxID=2909341 RepID=A0ABS9CTU1_9RHOB|nr:hypothetical protein [Octadecabacter dasysiphoniae]MCF2869850.1 hypothetical protein [Octadecabacter dasysiphoniae]
MNQKKLPVIVLACAALASCTAGSRDAVLAAFPAALTVQDVTYFRTNRTKCTFAQVSISPDVTIDGAVFDASSANLKDLAHANQTDFDATYAFPQGGFAMFRDVSLVDVVSDFDVAGDTRISTTISETMTQGRACLNLESTPDDLELRRRASALIADASGVVIIGATHPHTTILYLSDENVAFYFGP